MGRAGCHRDLRLNEAWYACGRFAESGTLAQPVSLGLQTVANTCTQLKAKLGVRTLPELMRIAIRHLPSAAARAPREWS
jgi:hypothetical protein